VKLAGGSEAVNFVSFDFLGLAGDKGVQARRGAETLGCQRADRSTPCRRLRAPRLSRNTALARAGLAASTAQSVSDAAQRKGYCAAFKAPLH
jgi:hypothetical protein